MQSNVDLEWDSHVAKADETYLRVISAVSSAVRRHGTEKEKKFLHQLVKAISPDSNKADLRDAITKCRCKEEIGSVCSLLSAASLLCLTMSDGANTVIKYLSDSLAIASVVWATDECHRQCKPCPWTLDTIKDAVRVLEEHIDCVQKWERSQDK